MDSLFDIKLIKEFEKCPAFYDRNCVNFKNKQYLTDAWENIAQKLGYRGKNYLNSNKIKMALTNYIICVCL